MKEPSAIGPKVRGFRRRANLTQVQLAGRLGISPSYLNLIEQNRRPLTAALLLKMAEQFHLDLKAFSTDDDTRVTADLLEVFGDPMFEDQELTAQDVRDVTTSCPSVARAVLKLYRSYCGARESADTLASKLTASDDVAALEHSRLPSEEVTDLLQQHLNYFPELEKGAEALWTDGVEIDDVYEALVAYLKSTCNVEVRVEQTLAMQGAVRRYEADVRLLALSEVLRRGSRNFQVAYQIGLLTQSQVFDRIAADPLLTNDESRALCRIVLANYFAAAVLMPYRPFLEAARTERYDLELLGHRFRTNFEQVCHRLTTLRRPGAEGVPFHMVRVDIAGNISKRFSASGLRFARFSGACPRWNVFAAFLTPGMIKTQVSQMPDGTTYFWVSRTVEKAVGGFHAPHAQFAIGLGCDVSYARQLVYADGIDLDSKAGIVPVGVSCRVCERVDCDQRALPPLQHRLRINENVRSLSFYAPLREKDDRARAH